MNNITHELEPFLDHRGYIFVEAPGVTIFFGGIADIISFSICGVYVWSKHWIARNILTFVFAINYVAKLHLNTILNGWIFLGLLIINVILLAYKSDVMVTIERSIEVPTSLVFPQNRLYGNRSSLGLESIILPGAFIALLLRFDESLQRQQDFYFYSSFCAYAFGLIVTEMNIAKLKKGQPASLYLFCVGVPVVIAYIKGDFYELLNYCEYLK